MAVASMTGFARAEGHADGLSWTWELKSVNGKSLDLRIRLPQGFDELEPPLRAALAKRLKRGNITINLALRRSENGAGALRINRAVLADVLALVRELSAETELAPPRLDGLLSIRGVVASGEDEEIDEEARRRRAAAMLHDAELALERLAETREGEGARLTKAIETRLAEIAALADTAERSAAVQPEAIRARLKAQVAALLDSAPALPEERLVQEAALLAVRADIREELDRLRAHIAAARELLQEGGAVGRRLDFLCQEFNREANTLCSKSADVELTRIGLALKAAIEQMREQVQNIE